MSSLFAVSQREKQRFRGPNASPDFVLFSGTRKAEPSTVWRPEETPEETMCLGFSPLYKMRPCLIPSCRKHIQVLEATAIMAESMCGPSNALQSFQKHSSADRTLQQDRLARGRNEQQVSLSSQELCWLKRLLTFTKGFRSPQGLGGDILDAEFEAFQASQPVPPGFEYQGRPFHNGPLNPPVLQNGAQNPQLPAWALDFQSLHLNEHTQNQSPHLSVDQAPHSLYQKPSSWQQEFHESINQSSAGGLHTRRDFSHTPQMEGINTTFQRPFNASPQGYLRPSTAYQNEANGSHKPAEASQQDTDQMFDKEFAQVALDAEISTKGADREILQSQLAPTTAEQYESIQSVDDGLVSSNFGGALDNIAEEHQSSAQMRIGSDRILDEAEERSKDSTRDAEADELARTAGTLLERVQGETNQKFKQSTFLSLMRQLRDKDAFVEGDKLIYVSHKVHVSKWAIDPIINLLQASHSLHPGGQHYPSEQT